MRASIRNQTIESIMSPLLDGPSVRVVRLNTNQDQEAIDAAVADALAVVDGLPASLRPSVRRELRKALDDVIYRVPTKARAHRFEAAEAAFKTRAA